MCSSDLKKKERKELRTVSETSGRTLNTPTFELYRSQKEKKKGSEKTFEEITGENFPNMGKEIATQVQEAQRVPYRINPRRNTPRYIVIKLAKITKKNY